MVCIHLCGLLLIHFSDLWSTGGHLALEILYKPGCVCVGEIQMFMIQVLADRNGPNLTQALKHQDPRVPRNALI